MALPNQQALPTAAGSANSLRLCKHPEVQQQLRDTKTLQSAQPLPGEGLPQVVPSHLLAAYIKTKKGRPEVPSLQLVTESSKISVTLIFYSISVQNYFCFMQTIPIFQLQY